MPEHYNHFQPSKGDEHSWPNDIPNSPNFQKARRFGKEAKDREQRQFASYFLANFSRYIAASGRDILDVSRQEVRDYFHRARIRMNEQWGDDIFRSFNMTHVLGEVKATVAWYEELAEIDGYQSWSRDLRWYGGIQDLFEKVLHRTPQEEEALQNIEREAQESALHQLRDLASQFPSYLHNPHYRFFADESDDAGVRTYSGLAARTLIDEVGRRREAALTWTNAPEPFDSVDAYLHGEWYRSGEPVEFMHTDIMAATKRELLSSYYGRDRDEAGQDRYSDAFTAYHLISEAVKRDASPTS
jgi:hypothetical protein